MFNILTIDVEDYFQVHAFSDVIKFDDWSNYECRIERNIDRLLAILNQAVQNSKLKTQTSKLNDPVRSPQELAPRHRSTSALKNNSKLSTQHSKLSDSVPSPQPLNLSPSTSRLAKDYLASSPCAMRSAPCESPKGTFFILGWIAERYPDLVRRIQREGHEIACHGYAHKLIYTQSKDEFRQDIRKSKAILEDITGSEVIGYRGSNYSITNKSRWAFEILAEEGFKYDSSIFPIRHDVYGMPDAPRFPFVVSLNRNNNFEFLVLSVELDPIQNSTLITQNSRFITQNSNFSPESSVLKANSLTPSLIHSIPDHSKLNIQNSKLNLQTSQFIIEFPLSTVKVFGQNFPISGGGYFRLFPYSIVKKGLKRINEVEKQPFIFYLHPWEVDFKQPRIPGLKLRSRLRHYVNLDKTESRFKRLLGDFQFSAIRQLLTQNS